MTRDELRLELLKLTFNHAQGAVEAVTKAKILEDFVLERDPVISAEENSGTDKKGPGRPRKVVGNSTSLG